jgi:hypothetical protein
MEPFNWPANITEARVIQIALRDEEGRFYIKEIKERTSSMSDVRLLLLAFLSEAY